jgi:hypothetical protein
MKHTEKQFRGESAMLFNLSDALTPLCNALFVLPNWFGVLVNFGLASEEEFEEMMYFGQRYPGGQAAFYSWDNLKCHLDAGCPKKPEQLRSLCNDLLRHKDTYAAKAKDENRFSDFLAEFVVQLEKDGFRYDGYFSIVDVEQPSSSGA